MVSFPTRSNNILDLIVTNVPEKVTNVRGFDDSISTDHKLIGFDLNLKIPRKSKTKRVVYIFKRTQVGMVSMTHNSIPRGICALFVMMLTYPYQIGVMFLYLQLTHTFSNVR